MKPTYKQLDDDTLEVTIYEERKIIIKKADLEAQKTAITATDTSYQDDLLDKFK